MKFMHRIIAVFLVTLIASNINAQNISNKGKEFWVGYGFHQQMADGSNTQDMTLYLSVEDLPAGKNYATVVVEADSSGANPSLWWRRVYRVPANTVVDLANNANLGINNAYSFSPACAKGSGPIPKGAAGECWDLRLFDPSGCANIERPFGHGIFRGGRGIHVTSDVDMVVFAHIYTVTNSGATMLLPTSSWGYSYTTINSNQTNASQANNFFYVVAQEDNTVVRITPSQLPYAAPCITDQPGVAKTITLHKGWIYQYVGFLDNNTENGVQLTGSKIESLPNQFGKCNKIAVFAGSGRTGGETGPGCGPSSRDNDMQQCFPEHTWGNTYLAAPWATGGNTPNACGQAGTVYKIVAKDTGTYVRINKGLPQPIPLLGFVRYTSATPTIFESNKPISVGQFMTSGNCGTGGGDPEMAYISPIDQAISKVGFYRTTETGIDVNFVAIIIPDSGLASLKISRNGSNTLFDSLGNNFGGNSCVRAHPQSPSFIIPPNTTPTVIPYSIVIKGWTSANQQVIVKNDKNIRFNILTYGLGVAESYAYSGGTFLNNLAGDPKYLNVLDLFSGDTIPRLTVFQHKYTIDRTPTQIAVAMQYPPKRIDWLFDEMKRNKDYIDSSKIDFLRVCDSVKWDPKVDTQRGYFYTPPFQFNGNDTFYTKGCSPSNSCVTNMHVVTVGCALYSKNPGTKYFNVNTVAPVTNNAVIDLAPACGNPGYTYKILDIKTGIASGPSGFSNRGGVIGNVLPAGSNFSYLAPNSPVPRTQYVGMDTFYIQCCDTKGECIVKQYIVTIRTPFSIDKTTISNATPVNTNLTNNAALEANPVGGRAGTGYNYSVVDANGNAATQSAGGASITMTGSNYTYIPVSNYTGLDSFYISVCDNNIPNTCLIQKHIVTVGMPYNANSNAIQNFTTLNTAFNGNASINTNVTGGVGSYTFSIVNASGTNVTTSNKGFTVTIKPNNGIYTYTPTGGFLGKDTFYTKVCDASATANCTIQMIIVNVSAAFTTTAAITTLNENVNNQALLNGQASTQINPTGGNPTYKYDFVDLFKNPLGLNALSRRGASIQINPNGNYQYTPLTNFVGVDTFWVRVSDSSTTPNSIVQMHVVSVFPGIIGNTLPFYHSIASDGTLSGNMLQEMPTIPNVSLSKYTTVDIDGNYTKWSSRVKWSPSWGEVSMVPLPIDTLFDSIKGNRYFYKALPTLDPRCDYVFVKKDPLSDKIDTVYIPIVVYSKPKNGLPTGCYGAGGLIGDTIKLVYYIYPNPRINKIGRFQLTSCPTDNTISFNNVDSSIAIPLAGRRFILPVIRTIWNIRGKLNGVNVNYIDTAKTVSHKFDTGTTVCFRLTTIFTNGATNTFDTCFLFTTSQLKMKVSPTRVCINSPIIVKDLTFSSTGKDSSYWDFGNGTIKYGDSISYIYPADGKYTIRHTIKINNCNAIIDTISQEVNVDANLHPIIAYPLNCIDTSGKADFWRDTSMGGTPTRLYNWTFFDKNNSSIGTSILNPVTFNFPKEDSFRIKLYVEDTLNCKGDTTITVLIHIKPNIRFNLFTQKGICANADAINIKDSASCLNFNKVKGYGKFKGRGISDSIGIYNPKLVDPFLTATNRNDTVWYVYYDSTGLCVDSIAQVFEVYKKPTVDWDYTPKGCLPKDGKVSFKNSSLDGFDFFWNFDDAANTYYLNNANIVNGIDTSHSFYSTGLHNVKLFVISDKGCKDSLTKPITFTVTPDVVYNVLSSVCESATTYPVDSARVINGVDVSSTLFSGIYSGNGISPNGQLSPAVAGYGNIQITYIANLAGCADTAYQTKLIKARPRIGFTYPVGCLPANGIVQFLDTSRMPDAQTIQSCAWNFGDPGSGANTANTCNAAHVYSYGTYTVYHSVTSSLGCFSDTTFQASFSIRPSLQFDPIIVTPCENDTVFNVGYARSTNLTLAPGTGIYKCATPGSIKDSVLGIFNPYIAGAGNHTIWYVFTTTSGCKDSVSRTISVKDRPKGIVTHTPSGPCLASNGAIQFSAANISVQNASIASYNWDFGDGIHTGTNMTGGFGYTKDSNYTIRIIVTADNGCKLDSSFTKPFYLTPSLSGLYHADVCQNTSVQFVEPTPTNNVVGTGVFTNFAPITNTISPTGLYSTVATGYDSIIYTFTSKNNCSESVSHKIKVNELPSGAFVLPTGCLDTAGNVQLNANTITVGGGSIIDSVHWYFNSPNLSDSVKGKIVNYQFKDSNYTIIARPFTSNLCSTDIVQTIQFSRTPHIAKLSQGSICTYGGNVPLKVPDNLNQVPGTGSFWSTKNAVVNGTDYDPAKAGSGADTLYYKFVNANNPSCFSVDSIEVFVKSQAVGTLQVTSDVSCLDVNGLATFDARSYYTPSSSIINYRWEFGDGDTANGDFVTHNYKKDAIYVIKLIIKSANGCDYDTSIYRQFSIAPNFGTFTQNPVCENEGLITIAPPTITNGAVAQDSSFHSVKGAFVDSVRGIYDPSKAGTYGTDTIIYTFKSKGGCIAYDTLYLTIKETPQAKITYSPLTCLDTSGKVIFDASASLLSTSTFTKYDWTFVNGSVTGFGVSPTHYYASEGKDSIVLIAIAANGCKDTTGLSATFGKHLNIAPMLAVSRCENTDSFLLVKPNVLNNVTVNSDVFWSNKNAVLSSNFYSPRTAGYGKDTVYYKATSQFGCTDSTMIEFDIKARPYGTFKVDPDNGCVDANGRVQFTANIDVPNSSINKYTWDFGNTKTGNGKVVIHNYTQDNTYNVKLNIVGNNTCVFDTAMAITVNRKPRLARLVYTSPICENGNTFDFTAPAVLNNVIGMGIFTSNKGGITNSIAGTYDPKLVGFGKDTIKYTYTSLNGNCPDSQTLVVNILGAPTGTFTFDPPSGCLDVTGKVKFITKGITVNGSAIKTYAWQFEAPNAPIIAGPSPTHNYQDGVYDINLKATAHNSCVNDFWIRNQPFSRKPDIDPITLANKVCANSGSFLLNAPSITNNVVGPAGVFTSFKNNITGNSGIGYTYTPVVSNNIIDTIYYTFTSNNQCSTTVKKVIFINPVPVPKLVRPINICVNNSSTLVDNSIVFGGNIDSTWWIFNDTTIINPPGKSVTRNFNTSGVNGIRLTIMSDSGCVASDSFNVNVRPKPSANFSFNNTVCMPNGLVNFSNRSLVDPFGGTLKYVWNFGDVAANISTANPNTSTAIDAKHTYGNIGNYIVKLVAISKEYGCSDSMVDTLGNIGPFYQKPTARFYTNKEVVCEEEFIEFKDSSSSAPGSSLYRWNWTFGDGYSTATTIPTTIYAYNKTNNSRLFTATLTVRSKELCESEPISKIITVYPKPHIDSMPLIYAVDGSVIFFKPKVKDSVNFDFTWNGEAPYYTAGFSNPNSLSPSVFISLATVLGSNNVGVNNPPAVYQLVGTGQNNCSDTAYQLVKILSQISIPNSFSPNGDNINDTWDISGLGDYPNAKMDLYDRYGNKLITFTGTNTRWDGRINGTNAPVATYYYVIKLEPNAAPISGWVTLLR